MNRHRHEQSSSWAALQASHRSVSGNTIRAAVLGANDGLVSNLSLVAGVAGASLAAQTILITGFAGLAAGSCAMAMGEWISVQTSREVNERELRVESQELMRFPDEETEERAALYESRGLAPAGARQLAEGVIANGPLALEVMAREELGIDPDQLGVAVESRGLTVHHVLPRGVRPAGSVLLRLTPISAHHQRRAQRDRPARAGSRRDNPHRPLAASFCDPTAAVRAWRSGDHLCNRRSRGRCCRVGAGRFAAQAVPGPRTTTTGQCA